MGDFCVCFENIGIKYGNKQGGGEGGEGVSELTPFPPNHHHPTSPDLPKCSMYVQYLEQGDLIQIFAVFLVSFARVEGSYDKKIWWGWMRI